jgi:small multidrug resistance pump
LPIGIAYGIWSGAGIILVAVAGWIRFGEALDLAAIVGLGLIISGLTVINVFSKSVTP